MNVKLSSAMLDAARAAWQKTSAGSIYCDCMGLSDEDLTAIVSAALAQPITVQVLGLNDMPIAVFTDVEVAERERLRVHLPHPTLGSGERARFGWIRDFELDKVPYLPGIHPPPYVPRYTVSITWSPAALKYIVQKWEVGKQGVTEPMRVKGLREAVLKGIELCELEPVCGLWMDDNVTARLAEHGSPVMQEKVAIYNFGSKP